MIEFCKFNGRCFTAGHRMLAGVVRVCKRDNLPLDMPWQSELLDNPKFKALDKDGRDRVVAQLLLAAWQIPADVDPVEWVLSREVA